MPLPDLDILVAIAETGSLTAAAVRLDLPRPTLSRRLQKLEEDYGARLVHRTTRSVQLTETGKELFRHARPIVDAVQAAGDAVRARDGVPRGVLRISIPGSTEAMANMFIAFGLRHPEVRLELVSAARHVDLVAEGFDIAIRAGYLSGPSLVSRRLATTANRAVASPGYLEQFGVPQSIEELVEHACLVSFERGEVPRRSWPLLAGGRTPVSQRLASNDLGILLQGALSGMGMAMLPDLFLREPLADGRLVVVLPELLGARTGVWLVYPEKRLVLPRVRAFIEHTLTWMETHPVLG